MNQENERLSGTGIVLLASWILLVLTGLLMTISVPSVYAQERFGNALFFFKRQLIFAVLAGITIYLVNRIPYRLFLYPRFIQLTFATTTLFLFLVLILPPIRSVHRWIHIGPFTFQPSELAKFALVLYIAYHGHRLGSTQFKRILFGALPVTIITLFWGFLILKEPDLGNTVIFLGIALTMLYMGGTPLKTFLIPAGSLASITTLLIIMGRIPSYWMDRIMAYLDPEQYALTIAYQRIQAMIALGHGGFFGVGYGRSLQKLYYLPEAHHDYVFAIIGEEFGLIGTLFVLGLYLVFLIAGFQLARRNNDFGGRLLAAGLTTWIGLQALTNISIVTGLFPPKGLVLPFVSYGGTSLMLHSLATGILLSLDRFRYHPVSWLHTGPLFDDGDDPTASWSI